MAINIGNKYLKAWLRFNRSPTDDVKGNIWTTYGNPTIGTANAISGNALQLDGQSYIKLSGIELCGQDFCIDGWVYVDAASPNYARIFSIVNPTNGCYLLSFRKSANDSTKLDFFKSATTDVSQDRGYSYNESTNSVGKRVYFKFCYSNNDGYIRLYINDVRVTLVIDPCFYLRQTFDIYIGARRDGNQGLIGAIDELRIYDGTVLLAGDGTNIPTAADYSDPNIYFYADIKTNIHNALLEWRYENPGTADLLTTSGTTVTGLTPTQSKTGTAFYQTEQAKCFDIPSTKEIWIKCDVYCNLTDRWRVYNEGFTGICSQTNKNLDFWANDNKVKTCSSAIIKNQRQTVLLHMVSDSTAGIVEAWLDGTKLYTYTGNVNNGDAFAGIYLQSDGAGTFFSNVIISNSPVDIDEDVDLHSYLNVDLARSTSNAVTANFDTSRSLVATQTLNVDTARNTAVAASLNADSMRKVSKALIDDFDTARGVANAVTVNLDTARELAYGFKESIDFRADSLRNVSNALTANIDTARNISGAVTVSADVLRNITAPISLSADTLRIVTDPNVWRYENYGIADLLSGEGTFFTVENLDKSQAIYKSAFYQTERAKCFDIPATKEIWIKCDIWTPNRYSVSDKIYIGSDDGNGLNGWSQPIGNEVYKLVHNGSEKYLRYKLGENTRYRFLLHMKSGSSDGLLEVYIGGSDLDGSFSGNVNNGDDFKNVYISTGDSIYATGNNEILISNLIISNAPVDINENVYPTINLSCDTLRFFPSNCLVSLDTARNVLWQAPLDIDTYRFVTCSVDIIADIFSTVNYAVQIDCDVVRTLPHKFIISPVEEFGGTPDTSNDAKALTQSLEIRLNEQSLTDEVVIATVKPVDIMEQVQGQYLDYPFNMRIETCKQRGILNTCTCCSDIDEILYKQLEYTIPDDELWRFTNPEEVQRNFPGIKVFRRDSAPLIEEDDDNSEDFALASTHIATIANIIGKTPILQYADFISTVDITAGGTTYNDLIRSIFGWTARIPQHMINCFLRDDKLFVVQRGFEQNDIHLSNLKGCEIVGIDKELMRTIWGSSVWSKTETREVFGFRYIDNLKWSEEPEVDDEESSQPSKPVRSTSRTSGGLIKETVEYHNGVKTTTTYDYDDDELVIQTVVCVEAEEITTRTITTYEYITLDDGRKVLEKEKIREEELGDGYWEIIDEKTTTHEYTATGPGQVHHYTTDSDGNVDNVIGNGTGDDRRTPYAKWITAGGKRLLSYQSIPKYYQQQRTIYGLTPFDTSFPVHGNEKLIEVTNAIKWLNRRTQETLTLNLFDYPHVIDFNDRIVINGNVYYLKGNTALKTPRIVNKQTLSLVRWY